MKSFIQNTFFYIILLSSACTINSDVENSDAKKFIGSEQYLVSKHQRSEVPNINPNNEFETIDAPTPITEWNNILRNEKYMSFRFKTKSGEFYWALFMLLQGVYDEPCIYMVIHNSSRVIYKDIVDIQMWRKKSDHSVIAISPILDPDDPSTWSFPFESKLDRIAVVFKNGRGKLVDILETPQKTDFAVKPYVVGLSSIDDRTKEITNIVHTTRLSSPILNHAVQDEDVWMEFEYKKGYWMQYRKYDMGEFFGSKFLYRILKNGKVLDEGVSKVKYYMTLDRYESEGALVFEKSVFKDLDPNYRTLNLFRKPLKGTRGNISTGVYLDKSNFEIWYATNPPTRSQEMILIKKAESFIRLNKSGSFY